MTQGSQGPLPNQDNLLLDYVQRLNKHRKDRLAVRVHLSRLRPHNRREHHLRIAASTFDTLVQRFEGALFTLYNGDLVLICKGATVSDIDDGVLRVRYLFSEDPLFRADEEEDVFCTWYDLEQDYRGLLLAANQNAEARAQYDAQLLSDQEEEAPQAIREGLPPIGPAELASVVHSIESANLSSMLRRQPICAIVRGEKPRVLFNEVYTSIDALHQVLTPDHDPRANRWLFAELTRHLDLRMITLLANCHESWLNRAFSLNLNVETLLTPAFLDFDAALNAASRRTIVIELQLFDIVADIGSYYFAREFLHDRNFRLCMDGVSYLALPLVDREALGIDLIKLRWNTEMFEHINGPQGSEFREALKHLTPERLILDHCDSEQAFEFGRSVGITMYQGFHVDGILRDSASPEESIHALSEAQARNRAAARALERAS